MSLVKASANGKITEARHNDESSNVVWQILVGISGSINICIILLLICLWIYFTIFYRKKYSRQSVSGGRVSDEYSVRCFSYEELSNATNGFRERIGSGAYGVVYKGMMVEPTGTQIDIAVKELDSILHDPSEKHDFKSEVESLGRTHHKNLVQLIGYCEEMDHHLLVYEYMSNGTLSNYLYVNEPKPAWEKRLKISQGVARGLLYLHQDCSTKIIHCDIKPQNILLDYDHNARISDFGLAKILGLDQTQTNTMARGTRGYIAPEWCKNMAITTKVDVYSFGTLLLEIICCRCNVYGGDCEQGVLLLTDRAVDCYQCGNIQDLVEADMEALNDYETLIRMVKVSIWCIQDDPNLRPTMEMVVLMLDGVVQVPEPPCPIDPTILF